MARHVTYKKVKYSSLTALCTDLKLDYNQFYYWKSKGYSVKAVVTRLLKKQNNLTYKGKHFDSLSEVATYFDLPYGKLARRFSGRGLDLEAILPGMLAEKETKIDLSLDGVTYQTIVEASEHTKIPYSQLWRYLHADFTRTLATAVRDFMYDEGVFSKYVYRDVKYSSAKNLGTAIGINANVLTKLVHKDGHSIDVAVSLCLARKRWLEVNGKRYSSYAELCRDLGLSYDSFTSYRERGNTTEVSILKAKKIGSDCRHPLYRKVTYKGVEYSSVRSLARAFEVSYERLLFFLDTSEDVDYSMSLCLKYRDKVS